MASALFSTGIRHCLGDWNHPTAVQQLVPASHYNMTAFTEIIVSEALF